MVNLTFSLTEKAGPAGSSTIVGAMFAAVTTTLPFSVPAIGAPALNWNAVNVTSAEPAVSALPTR